MGWLGVMNSYQLYSTIFYIWLSSFTLMVCMVVGFRLDEGRKIIWSCFMGGGWLTVLVYHTIKLAKIMFVP